MKPKNKKKIRIRLRISLASPERLKKLSERKHPNGKILGQIENSQTVNYKTLKPEKGGLFCETIFGPINDFECACGIKKIKQYKKYCPECDVEYTFSKVRRHRLGHIELLSPVTHVWYLKGRPSYIAVLLNMPKKKVEALTYCTELSNISSDSFSNKNKKKIAFFEKKNLFYSLWYQESSWEIKEDWSNFKHYIVSFIEKKDIPIRHYRNENYKNDLVQHLGAEVLRDLFVLLDLDELYYKLKRLLVDINQDINNLEDELEDLEKYGNILHDKEHRKLSKFIFRQIKLLMYNRAKKIRRLKLVKYFRRTQNRPEWMILSILPVLPPELRPIIQLDGDQVAVSDLNKLYQKVLFRNNRIKKNYSMESDEIKYSRRLLQEAVDALLENGKGGTNPICASNDRPLKSLSDILKGKKGRFRQNLLGKRVDYSGRSVIVVGPNLHLHECGLPKEIAIELFQPFLIRSLMAKKIVRTIVGAKRFIQNQNPKIWQILEQVLENHPVLLNRAPTLHRVGIQSFLPKLVDGRAILLHPLVCTSFNADFDGDQMAIHIPLTFEAHAEAWFLMWSRNNLLSPATGQPLIAPSQDMILGCYYLTAKQLKIKKKKLNNFVTINECLKTYDQKKIDIHLPIWIRWQNTFETINEQEKPLEIQISSLGPFTEIYTQYRRNFSFDLKEKYKYIRTTPGRVLLNKNLAGNSKISL